MSDVGRQWMITSYALAFGGLLLGGRIADLAGRKRILVTGLLGFAAASLLGGLAPTSGILFAARALQGAFAALLAPAALSLITVAFTDPEERAKAFGIYGAFQGGGGAVGLLLGGVLTEYVGWRWCMFINVPIALAMVVAARPIVRESRAEGERRPDIPGAALATGGLVSLVFGFTEAAQGGGWAAPPTLLLLAAALVLLTAFVMVERRSARPMLPLRVISERNRAGVFLGNLFIGAGMFGMNLSMTYFLQVNLHYTPLQAGFAFLWHRPPPSRAQPISEESTMNDPVREVRTVHDPASFWEHLYRSKDHVWKGTPNPVLAETAARFATPGTALDLGCGEGGDAVWLARQGWSVIAVDIAATALARVDRHAAREGVADRVTTEQHDLSSSFPAGTFDLISAQYLQTPFDFARTDVLRQAANALKPQGLLLLVDHGSVRPWAWDTDPDQRFPTPESLFEELALDPGQWTAQRLATPQREATGPGGRRATVTDTVVTIQRTT